MKPYTTTFCFLFFGLFATSCQKEITAEMDPVQIVLVNPGFEDSLNGWKIETDYAGSYGFTALDLVVRSGKLALNFYVSQPHHFPGAGQETPWNGKIYQTITGLKDGHYSFKAFADAVGEGMYLWAHGGDQEVKALIKSSVTELNTLDFVVQGGEAKIGFICVDAKGEEQYAPYFHADDLELWKK